MEKRRRLDPSANLGSPDHGLQRRRKDSLNHPIYAERETKEHALLEDLIARDPPNGGLANYIFDLERAASDAVEIYAMLLGIPVDLDDPEPALLAAVERGIRALVEKSIDRDKGLHSEGEEDSRK